METMGYSGMGHKKYRPPLSPTNFYQHDMYSRPSTLRPQSEYRFAGGGYPPSAMVARSKAGGGLCSAALIGGALLAAVAVLGVAALAFYMGALRPDNGEPIMSFEGTLRVTRGDVYGGAPGSPAWKERARRYGAALKQVYAAPSPLKQAFAGALVTNFGDQRLDVHFRLYLDRRKIPSSVSNIEEALKNILVQDILSKQPAFGQIKIDLSSIVIKRDLEHTYHSESYVREAMNETITINNHKPSPVQNAKDKTLQTRIGVVRKTTVKPNQSSKKKDLEEPDIDTESLPVVQGTFQITKTDADITENKLSSSPTRHEDKITNKLTTTKKTTTSSYSTTFISSTPRSATTRKISSTIPKSRPFATKSTLNIKPRTESTSKSGIDYSTSEVSLTEATMMSTIAYPSTTTIRPAMNNVSHILLGLLTDENQYKDLPKIDTMFTVPHIVDDEPWRPITRPFYDTTTELPLQNFEIQSKQNVEDRIGIAEVVDDVSILESILSPIPPAKYEGSKYEKVQDYPPTPVYTSFTLSVFPPLVDNMETLGSSYPKPHPLPVDKISLVVEDSHDMTFDSEDDGRPVERPPKDNVASLTLTVMQLDSQGNSTEKVSVEGASILKKNNVTSDDTSESKNIIEEIITTTGMETTIIDSTTNRPIISTNNNFKNPPREYSSSTSKESITKRPNDKVSVIPSTSIPHHTWELVNTSTIENVFNKNSPQKQYNDTLQAIITKNDVVFPNTTPKFQNKIVRNITDIIKKYSQDTLKKPVKDIAKTDDDDDDDDKLGSVEVVDEEDLETTSVKVITLLPAKSNLGVNRPLRPRPKIKNNQQTPDNQHKSDDNFLLLQKIVDDITTEKYMSESRIFNYTVPFFENAPILTTGNGKENNTISSAVMDNFKVTDKEISLNKKRFPKASDNLKILENVDTVIENKNENMTLPEGTYKVTYHVTGSVSSKRANKTQIFPAYELALEPDVVLEIPVNQSHSLTAEKLKQLASLATISDVNSSLIHAPGPVISTKAIPSHYTLNQAGFKILTKIYNKVLPSKSNKNELDKLYVEKNKFQGNRAILPQAEREECNNTTFRCANGACLPEGSRCNRQLDCPGGEDERGCSCADYLRANYSELKICDGVVDCWDYSDENECEWCEEGQYVCANARQCVEMGRVCDGNPDCPLGDDEKSCVALGDDVADNEVIPYNEEGFLMVRKRGVWGRLCVESFEEVVQKANSLLKLPDLGRAVCKAMTFKDSTWAREAREGRKASSLGYWEVSHNSEARAADSRLTFRRSTCARHRALRVRCQELECGIRPHADVQQPRVVGGDGAAAGAWPWQAALYKDGDFQCGGTLVAAQWLLSAGHCFYQATEAHWVARMGALRRGSWPRGPWERVARVRQVAVHPQYAAVGFRHDIALLRVDPVPLHARLRPACLPPARTPPPTGRHCTVVGWGQLSEYARVFPDTLQEVSLPVLSTAECRARTRLLPLYSLTEDMFCAGYDGGGRDACLGDSGGPLMCQEEDNKWYIHGVTSNGYGCARANHPGVYTKVANYIEWMHAVMEAHEARAADDLLAAEARARGDSCRGHRCPLGECLSLSSICNGHVQCSDGSDEWYCDSSTINNSTLDPD